MGSAIGSVAGGVASLFGGRARRREEREARAAARASEQALNEFEFTNVYAGLENTAEDLTVNQQAAEFQGRQADIALAQGLDAVVASGGGGGGAQAIANAALTSRQNISSSIAQQEQQNQRLRANQAAALQRLEAQGAEDLQSQQYAQIGDRYSRDADRFAKAQAARQQARQDLIGGIAGAGSIVAGGLIGGGSFGENLQENFGTGGFFAPSTTKS